MTANSIGTQGATTSTAIMLILFALNDAVINQSDEFV